MSGKQKQRNIRGEVPEPSVAPPAERGTDVVFPIVGIGASAGGLEAFGQLLQHVPADTGMAFVLIQHLDPVHESQLASLLARNVAIPVTEVQGTPVVEPNHVYVIPPNTSMTIERGQLQLTPRDRASMPHLSIDRFLRSLAADRQERAIGVLLSGTGSDGTAGLAEIKGAGGITFAQDEDSAKYPDMPQHAVNSGCVDFVLPPEAIAAELARIGDHPYLADRPPAEAPSSAPAQTHQETGFRRILGLLKSSSGVDFSEYRDQTLRRRIARRMALQRIESLGDYADYLEKNQEELNTLYRDMLINVTSFFRDAELFEILKTAVFPQIIKDKSAEVPVRIWVPGCSTGQEVYSLAISLLEFLDQAPIRLPIQIQIFGTDISESGAIERARAGFYSATIESELSPERLRRFFVKEPGGYRIGKAVRDLCVFARQNITTDPPFSRMDLISCRNLLIYLSSQLQRRIIPMLHYALNPTGFLLLGSSESVGRFTDLFKLVDQQYKIYTKNPDAIRPFPYFPADSRSGHISGPIHVSPANRHPNVSDLQREADRIDLKQYAPAGVLVNDELEVVQFRGRTRSYLEPPPGEASYDLLRMTRESLFLPLRNAIEEARKQHATVRKEGVRLRDDHKTHRVDIEVTPVRLPDSTHGGFLIHFHEAAGRAEPAASAVESPATPADDTEVEQLREELVAARSHLQSIIEQESAANEELKSANEEILSANEELQSTNEELQTAKEEAQSVNEELRTVNEELQSRNAEIARTNDDLSNLLSSVNTPIVMLGTDLCVRHFTSAASRVLNLTPADVGRSLDRLALPLNVPDLNGLLAEVIATAVPKERDVRDEQGHAYMLRIHPYRTLDNRIDGVTLVLFDIDSIRKAQQAVQASRDYAMAIVQTVQNPLLILDQDLRVRTASREYCETFRVTSQEVEGQLFYEMSGGQWDDVRLRSVLSSVLPSGVSVEEFEIERDFPRIGRRTLVISARRLLSEEGQTPLILLMLKDITDRKQLEARLQERMGEVIEANAAKDQFLAALSHELRTPLTPVLLTATSLEKRRDLPADVRDQLAALRRNIGLETRLIDDLLDLTRIARGKLKLDLRPCDACEFLKQTLQMYEGDIKAKQLHITLDLKAEHCSIMADGPRFQQVFWNLLNNAVKFTPPSGHIAIRAFNTERGRLVVEVADTGIGIGPDVLPRLFHAFEQGRSKVTRRYGGLGLGLAIAKAITECTTAVSGPRALAPTGVRRSRSNFRLVLRPKSV